MPQNEGWTDVPDSDWKDTAPVTAIVKPRAPAPTSAFYNKVRQTEPASKIAERKANAISQAGHVAELGIGLSALGTGALAVEAPVATAVGLGTSYLGQGLGGRLGKAVGGDTGETIGRVAGGLAGGLAGGMASDTDAARGLTRGLISKIDPSTAERLIPFTGSEQIANTMPLGERVASLKPWGMAPEGETVAKLKPWGEPEGTPGAIGSNTPSNIDYEKNARLNRQAMNRGTGKAWNPLSESRGGATLTPSLPLKNSGITSTLGGTRIGSAGDLASWTPDDLWSEYMNGDPKLKPSLANELARRGLVQAVSKQVRP